MVKSIAMNRKVIEIPLRWDEHSKKEIEDYSLFIEQSPIYTPEDVLFF